MSLNRDRNLVHLGQIIILERGPPIEVDIEALDRIKITVTTVHFLQTPETDRTDLTRIRTGDKIRWKNMGQKTHLQKTLDHLKEKIESARTKTKTLE